MKVLFKGEKSLILSSLPAGVLVTFKPGEEQVVDGGFDYLKADARFDVLDEDEMPHEKKTKASKAKE
jgi:hypothetical protein